jgi:hypothetical protein
LDIGVLGYIGILYHKEHPPEVWHIPPGTLCIFSISIFVVMNMVKFVTNSDIHGIHIRQGLDLHYPTCKLTKVQKGASFTGIRIFNNLPHSIKNLSEDINKFKYSLKKFLQVGSFYSLDEYYEWKTRDDCNSYR